MTEIIKIIPLPDVIEGRGTTKGFTFTKMKEGEKAYIYKVDDINTPERVWFEVIKRRATFILEDFENKIESTDTKKERYPKEKDWGKLGWTAITWSEANEIFDKIEKEKGGNNESEENAVGSDTAEHNAGD